MRALSRNEKIIIGIACLLSLNLLWLNAQDTTRQTANGTTPDLSVGDVTFTFTYGREWRLVSDAPAAESGAVLARIETDELGLENPVAALALTLVEAERAIDVFDDEGIFPYELARYTAEPQPLELDQRDAAIATGRATLNNETTLLLAIQVDARGLFVLGQAVSAGIDIEDEREAIIDIITSVEASIPLEPTATLTPTVPQPTAPPRDCPFVANINLVRVRSINPEEAGGARDFSADGDQILLTLELGPISGEQQVDPGRFNDFRYEWSAGLFAGDIREEVGEYTRDVCNEDFGFTLSLVEDDSTPFADILTPLGTPLFLPLVLGGAPEELPEGEQFAFFRGESQDGDYEYEVVYEIILEEQVGIDTSDLTPTFTPTFTPTATDTATATITLTPSMTFTRTPTLTFTPSNTPTATDTATITPTPSNTLTPSITPTPSNTFTPTITPTPSNTFTPTPTFTPSNTATATDTATITPTPPDTATPTASFTPSNTPTNTLTPTITQTPSATFTPSVTPTPTALVCDFALPTILYEGMFGRVVPGGLPNRVRSQPNLDGSQVGEIPPGERFAVTDGPECGDGLAWVEVSYQGVSGWTATGDDSVYWLEPLPGRAAFEPNFCMVEAAGQVNLREAPTTASALAGQLNRDDLVDVIGQATGDDGFTWYLLGNDAWVREDIIDLIGDCRSVPPAEVEE